MFCKSRFHYKHDGAWPEASLFWEQRGCEIFSEVTVVEGRTAAGCEAGRRGRAAVKGPGGAACAAPPTAFHHRGFGDDPRPTSTGSLLVFHCVPTNNTIVKRLDNIPAARNSDC